MFDLIWCVCCVLLIDVCVQNIKKTGFSNVHLIDIFCMGTSIAYIVRTILVYMGVI